MCTFWIKSKNEKKNFFSDELKVDANLQSFVLNISLFGLFLKLLSCRIVLAYFWCINSNGLGNITKKKLILLHLWKNLLFLCKLKAWVCGHARPRCKVVQKCILSCSYRFCVEVFKPRGGGGGEGALSVSFSVFSYVRPYVRLSVRPSQNVEVFARSLYVVSPPTSGREDHWNASLLSVRPSVRPSVRHGLMIFDKSLASKLFWGFWMISWQPRVWLISYLIFGFCFIVQRND